MMAVSAGLAVQEATTVGILGENSMVDDILEGLLQDAGYDTRIIDIPTVIGEDDPFAGIDVLLLSPGVDAELPPNVLGDRQSTTSDMAVLEIPTALKIAVLDDMAFSITWRVLFDSLLQRIEAAHAPGGADAG